MYRDVVGQAGIAAPGDRWSRGPQVIAWPVLDACDAVVFAAPVCFESVLVIYSLALRSLVLFSSFAEQKPYPRYVTPIRYNLPSLTAIPNSVKTHDLIFEGRQKPDRAMGGDWRGGRGQGVSLRSGCHPDRAKYQRTHQCAAGAEELCTAAPVA